MSMLRARCSGIDIGTHATSVPADGLDNTVVQEQVSLEAHQMNNLLPRYWNNTIWASTAHRLVII